MYYGLDIVPNRPQPTIDDEDMKLYSQFTSIDVVDMDPCPCRRQPMPSFGDKRSIDHSYLGHSRTSTANFHISHSLTPLLVATSSSLVTCAGAINCHHDLMTFFYTPSSA